MSLQFMQIPDWLFWGALFALGVSLARMYFHSWNVKKTNPIILLRFSLILILLFSYLSPKINQKIVNNEDLPWAIYLDNSISVGYHQNHSLGTINSGVWSLLKELDSKNISFKKYFFSDSIKVGSASMQIDGTGQMTDMGAVIQHIINSQDRLGGAVILTDGQITQGAGPRSLLKGVNIPIHTIGLGSTVPLVDISIKSVDVPTVAIKGDEIEATILISSSGTSQERLNVSLYNGNKMIGSRFVTVYGGESISEVRFRFKPENLGNLNYRVQVSSLSDEVNIQNNRQSFKIMILKDEYKIALLTGSPGFNTQVIKTLFSNQPRVKLQHYVTDMNKNNLSLRDFWETPFELIILDNFPTETLPVSWQKIFGKKLIAQKSALFWVVGPNQTSQTSKSIFPFFHVQSPVQILEKDERYRWTFNESAIERLLPELNQEKSGLLLNNFPPIRTGIELESLNSDYNILSNISTGNVVVPVLMLGEKEPFRYGIWTSPDFSSIFYQLKNTDNNLILPDLVSGISRWLMRTEGDKDMYFSLNKKNYQRGEQIFIYGNRIGNTNAYTTGSVSIIKDNSTIQNTQLRYNTDKERWEGQFWASSPGNYSYEVLIENNGSVSMQSGTFIIEESQVELNRVFLNSDLLKTISDASSGQFVNWESRADITDFMDFKQKTETYFKEIKLLENKYWLIFILLWFTIELAWRRYIGLV